MADSQEVATIRHVSRSDRSLPTAPHGLSRDLLYDEMRAGRLAYLKVGRRRIITRQQLETFLARGLSRQLTTCDICTRHGYLPETVVSSISMP